MTNEEFGPIGKQKSRQEESIFADRAWDCSRAGLEAEDRISVSGVLADIALRTCFAHGGTVEEAEALLSEDPGPGLRPCPYCGDLLPHNKVTDHLGRFVVWSPFTVPCPRPECAAKAAAEQAKRDELERRQKEQERARRFDEIVNHNLRNSGLPSKYRRCRFDPDPDKPAVRGYIPKTDIQRRALATLRAYAANYGEEHSSGTGLFLAGPVGAGKTHLAAALANELLCAGYGKILFVSSLDLLDNIKARFGDREGGSAEDAVETYKSASLLIIDDLGKEMATGWAMAILSGILQTRDAEERPTIITSNYTLEDLVNKLSERGGYDSALSLTSRINGAATFVPVIGPDHRRSGCDGLPT